MFALEYTITLIEPVLVTALDGDPNDAVSLPYIPGSALRGVWVRAFCKNKGLRELDASSEEHRTLFLNGDVCFLNAYPIMPNEASRTLPMPLSFQMEKNNPKKIGDLAESTIPDDVQWKSMSDPFCTIKDSEVQPIRVNAILNIHTQRDAKAGRAKKEDGAVFRYSAIEKRQLFKGVLLSEKREQLEKLKSIAPQRAWIGGAQSAGYGKVNLTIHEINNEWIETQEDTDIDESENVIVTCLSDVVFRNPNGTYGTSANDLKTYMGLAHAELKDVFAKNHTIGGFNRKWGLPLPQTPAIKMGSVFVFSNLSDAEEAKLLQFKEKGIGERKAEGFGRITLNWHGENNISKPKDEEGSSCPDRLPVANGDKDVVKTMLKRMWWAQAEQEIIRLAKKTIEESSGTLPPKSQLGQFRNVLRNGMNNPERVKQFMDHVRQKPTVLKKFSKLRIDKKNLFEFYNEPSEIKNLKNLKNISIGNSDSYVPTEMDLAQFKIKLLLEIVVRLSKQAEN